MVGVPVGQVVLQAQIIGGVVGLVEAPTQRLGVFLLLLLAQLLLHSNLYSVNYL